jgi:hypothetical protein
VGRGKEEEKENEEEEDNGVCVKVPQKSRKRFFSTWK